MKMSKEDVMKNYLPEYYKLVKKASKETGHVKRCMCEKCKKIREDTHNTYRKT